MPDYTLSTEVEVEDLIRGLALLGTGGGGRQELGRGYLQDALRRCGKLRICDVSELADDGWFCSTFGMGANSPRAAVAALPPYGPKMVQWPMVEAVRELERYMGITVSGIVAVELGASNVSGPLHAASTLNVLFPDGDYAGRAFPETSQCLPALHGKQYAPAVMCDEWGNVIIMKQTVDVDVAERFGKIISTVTKLPDQYSPCNFAAFLLRGSEVKQWIVPGTVTWSLRLGREIREARESGGDPLAAAAHAMGGWLLFTGIVAEREWENRDGYTYGSATIDGSGNHRGHTMKIWSKNENHVTWLDGKPFVVSPDLICLAQAQDGEPITNVQLQDGMAVAVLGTKAEWYRTEEGLKAMGPRHFGFEIDYRPIEEVVSG